MASAPKKHPSSAAGTYVVLAVCVLVFSFCNLMVYAETYKFLTLCALLAGLAGLVWRRYGGALGQRLSLPLLPLLGYILLCGLSVLWAQSGKFFLKEYARLLIAFVCYLAIVLCLPKTRKTARLLAGFLTAAAAVYAVASVDLGSLKLTAWIWNAIPDYEGISNGFESGTRLTGIFGNANILAGVLGLGILLGLYGLEDAQTNAGRRAFAVGVSLNAYGFLLAFSMGASGFFLLAVLAYLICAGRRRANVLLRMLECAVPTVVFVFVAFSCFEKTGVWTVVPLLAMAVNACITAGLETFVYPKLAQRLEGRGKLAGILIAVILVLLVVYIAAAVLVTGPAQLSDGQTLRRAVYPEPGKNELLLTSTGDLTVTITSQDEMEVMMHTNTRLYSGSVEDAVFTVPEGSRVVYLTFKAAGSASIQTASLAYADPIPLNYPLLPGFIANRLQGLWANENAIQRTVFFADGMELFREKPVQGMALGSFESASWGVQEFDYETKYVHNHYIQVLLDSGVVGLALFVGFLASLVWVWWSARKREDEFRALWPAAVACMVMVFGHAVMEVTLSASCYLPFAYGAFGLITLCFARPLLPAVEPAPAGGKSRSGKPAKSAKEKAPWPVMLVRWGTVALLGVYGVLLVCNMTATSAMKNNRGSYDDFFSALKTDIAIDAFEKNDAILSYVINSPASQDAAQLEQADAYADRLSQVRSNAIQNYLVGYYLKRGNAPGAAQAAMNGADFNRASQEVWNALFTTFHTYLLGDEAGKYTFDQTQAVQGVLALYDRMEYYNAEVLWAPIQLEETAQAVVDWCLTQ